MSKVGGAAGSAPGPTAAAAAAAVQKQKSLLQKADVDVSSLVDNFSSLINIARVNDPPVRNSQEAFQMEMRAARMPSWQLPKRGTNHLEHKTESSHTSAQLNHQLITVPSTSATESQNSRAGGRRRQSILLHRFRSRQQEVHSADSLLKLVSELKRTAIFSGLASLNENVDRRIEVLGQQAEGTERMLERIGQEAATSLKELEAHYYSSVVRSSSSYD